MSQATLGGTVKVHYTGKLKDGTVFGTSRGHDPLRIQLGAGDVIPGLERAIAGMSQGDVKNVELPAEEAYGPRRDEKVFNFKRSKLSADLDPQVGQQVQLERQGGRPVPAVVSAVSESMVTVDANHPLAGQDLTFDVELVEIV
jgi:FKBP-type peptidyl-prolyl cis-trans isomerase 2